jgi:hypothetical protein
MPSPAQLQQPPAARVVATMGISTFIYANSTTVTQLLLDADLKSAFLGDQAPFDQVCFTK